MPPIRNSPSAIHTLLTAAALATLSGCSWFGGGHADNLDANRRFSANPTAPAHSSPGGVDQPGFIHVDDTAHNAQNDSSAPPPPSDAHSDAAVAPAAVASVPPLTGPLREEIHTGPTSKPAVEAAEETSADAAPAKARPTTGRSIGSYMTLGGVVAEVNNRPIYANQVLREIIGPLSARAKELDQPQFQSVAIQMIKDQIQRLGNNERETAVAERNLDEKEKQTARLAAARWRQRQITENGGSLELAKRKWAAEGYDFEERVEVEYRSFLAKLYYSKKVWPRVQVTADEIRRYYNQHVNEEFTVRDEVRFRLIKIDPKRTGGREAALAKITDLRARATRGEDFSEMASTVNDNKFLMPKGGDVGWIQKGNYAVSEVEKAVWDLQPGQVSDIVDAGGAFYVAKLEERKLGRVMPFDEQAVQDKIVANLKAEEFRQLRDRVFQNLEKDQVVRSDRDMINSAVDMAMQNYPRWHAGETVNQ